MDPLDHFLDTIDADDIGDLLNASWLDAGEPLLEVGRIHWSYPANTTICDWTKATSKELTEHSEVSLWKHPLHELSVVDVQAGVMIADTAQHQVYNNHRS